MSKIGERLIEAAKQAAALEADAITVDGRTWVRQDALSEAKENNDRLRAENRMLIGDIERMARDNNSMRTAVSEMEVENERLREALTSIASNTCCDNCQEAAKVAHAALRGNEEI